jgi:hypothetical protein
LRMVGLPVCPDWAEIHSYPWLPIRDLDEEGFGMVVQKILLKYG